MSDENANKTLKVSPVSSVPRKSGTVLPDPASTQASAAAGMMQGQGAADGLHDLAQKTIKLAPPTRTGFQRPSPAPVAVPGADTPAQAPGPVQLKLHPAAPVPGAAAPESQPRLRTVARQTIKIAPPTRTGNQRPDPAASASPAAPVSDSGAQSAAKVPTLNLDFASIKAGAKRTQTVSAPFAEKTPMASEADKSVQESPEADRASAGAPTLSEATVSPELGKKTVSVPSPKIPEVQPEQVAELGKSTVSVPSPKGPTIQLKKPASGGEEAASAPSPKGPTIQLKKPAAAEAADTPSPKAPTIQMEKDDTAAPADTKTAKPASRPAEEPEAESEGEGAETAAEPGIVFTILSAVSLIVLLLNIYMLLAQYSALWLDGFNLPFPGLK